MVHERSGSILRWTGLDETIANKIIDALDRLLGAMADDPGHPLRLKIEDSLAELAFDLQRDPAMRDRVFRLQAGLLDKPPMKRWSWEGRRVRKWCVSTGRARGAPAK